MSGMHNLLPAKIPYIESDLLVIDRNLPLFDIDALGLLFMWVKLTF
ncbi:MAG: hypothetical protein C5S52_00105 [ANME-2 cluster archaeon]|nr:hypothetical protein [ANME-2 cluster archaeon]